MKWLITALLISLYNCGGGAANSISGPGDSDTVIVHDTVFSERVNCYKKVEYKVTADTGSCTIRWTDAEYKMKEVQVEDFHEWKLIQYSMDSVNYHEQIALEVFGEEPIKSRQKLVASIKINDIQVESDTLTEDMEKISITTIF